MQRFLRQMVVATLLLGSFLIGQVSYAGTREAAEDPGVVATGWSNTTSPEISRLLDDLHAAKKTGDMNAVWSIESELARLREKPLAFTPAGDTPIPGVRISHSPEEAGLPRDRWESDDIVVAARSYGEGKPVIVGDSQGRLYAAFEATEANAIIVYRSLNGGEYWQFFASLGHPTIPHINVSVAVAEGTEDWLIMAFEENDETLYIWRESIDGSGEFHTTFAYVCPDGLSNPRIVTDCSEYQGWYAYVVFNSMTVEGWAVCATRSIDFGQTWQEMPDIIGWHCDGWYAEDSCPNIDFGSHYLYAAYSTPFSPCSDENEEIYVTRSTDFGATWSGAVRLTTNTDLEYDPTVGAVKNYTSNKTAVIAYTRYYAELDDDVWYTYTQNGGDTWSSTRCLSCIEVDNERAPDLETSVSQGALHTAYWHDHMIDYAWAPYTSPTAWTKQTHINDGLFASADYPRPGVAVNPTRTIEEEAGICWTDERNFALNSYDIYYDGPGSVETGVSDPVARDPYLLACCGPNPFTTATSFCFSLPEASAVRVLVADVTGRVVRTLAQGRHPAGGHAVNWDGRGADGRRVPAGIYLVRLETETGAAARSVTVLR